jgi:hypothetical protein
MLAMKKIIIITSLIVSTILIFDSVNVGATLAMFVIAGQVPGTSTSLDAQALLFIYLLIAGFFTSRATSRLVAALTSTPRLQSVVNR